MPHDQGDKTKNGNRFTPPHLSPQGNFPTAANTVERHFVVQARKYFQSGQIRVEVELISAPLISLFFLF